MTMVRAVPFASGFGGKETAERVPSCVAAIGNLQVSEFAVRGVNPEFESLTPGTQHLKAALEATPRIKGYSPHISQQFIVQGVIPFLVSALAVEGNPPQDEIPTPDLSVGIERAPEVLMRYLELTTSYTSSPGGFLTFCASTAFTQSVLYPSWTAFKSIVHSRVSLVEMWEVDRAHSTMVCDNLQCQKVDQRDCFRRCSGCIHVAYCSQTCQRSDWVDGHRSECPVLPSAQVRLASTASGFRCRDRSFIRALLGSTYNTHRLDIAIKIIEFMVAQPNTLFLITYNFTPRIDAQNPIIEVHPLTHLDEPLRGTYSPRLARSRGLLTLHTVELGYNSVTLVTELAMYPLRRASTRFFDGLMSLAARSLGPPDLEDAVRSLIAATEGENEQFC
ncbi:hypothetical protein FB45DRAFT_1005391 [Roridomyces roridus]|uniref:MYND-type domain-containing protein n=1 Tax=Roridomyces roridus TaxID=1738132 RepID=A0AAD7FHH3_9AGAR|nr:hypothetical protein FB45DRAFT_1005391 [Roridomyces roridus]